MAGYFPREQMAARVVALLRMLEHASEATGAVHAAGVCRERASRLDANLDLAGEVLDSS